LHFSTGPISTGSAETLPGKMGNETVIWSRIYSSVWVSEFLIWQSLLKLQSIMSGILFLRHSTVYFRNVTENNSHKISARQGAPFNPHAFWTDIILSIS